MNLDDRLHQTRGWLDDATSRSAPDLADLDRRQRRRSLVRVSALSFAVFAVFAATIGYSLTRIDTTTVAAGAGSQPDPESAAAAPSREAAYILIDLPVGWQETTPPITSMDQSPVLAGEEFSQVYVRFDAEQDPFSAHSGNLTGTIRVAVGSYDDTLHDLFDGPSTRVVVSGRDFDVIQTADDQIVLVPVDVSERTFVLATRGLDADVVVAMATPIDPTRPVPRVGDPPDGFTVIHAGPPEFATLTQGTAVTYRNQADDQSFTVTTFNNQAISCFSNAWAYPDTEITEIGGDSGVVAQLEGQPGATGTYRALWNRGHNTLIGITARGIDRTQLIDLADQLTLDHNASGYESHLELIL